MSHSSSDDLFVQVRTAHRLLAAYYQRLLPTIESIGKEANTVFDSWTPQLFNRPGKNPFDKWQWDLLPALVARYIFKNVNDNAKVSRNDYVVEFIVINDSGIVEEERHHQPDGLKLKQSVDKAKSVLQVGIYRSAIDSEVSFDRKWNQGNYPDYSKKSQQKWDNDFVVAGFEVPLDNLMTDEGILAINEMIASYLEQTAEEISAHKGEVEA
ncbi:hypothetical protein AB4343_14865 [Vibrio breoganii]|uniref:Uncharacterized protein n=1 Tax=Vibrio breoganii TaxID=553239 RepID=A0AAP8MSW5_9VIBR|nr:hypothetical protein [Vibrio breoganii]PMP05822.1 hypothetical protein BCS93_18265 [Vibrio breoganii]